MPDRKELIEKMAKRIFKHRYPRMDWGPESTLSSEWGRTCKQMDCTQLAKELLCMVDNSTR